MWIFNSARRACAYFAFILPFEITKYVFQLLVNAQQSLVLLPLTNMRNNDYCAIVVAPTDPENAVCLYKYAAYALPYFFIFAIAAVVSGGCLYFVTEYEGSLNRTKAALLLSACVLSGLSCIFCTFIAAAQLVYYLFAGFFIGLWFQFGVFDWSLQTTRPEVLGMSLFIFNEIIEAFTCKSQNR
eukprot:gene29722-39419_t